MSSTVTVLKEWPLLGLDAGADGAHSNADAPKGLEILSQVGVQSQWESDAIAERTAITAQVSPAIAADRPREMLGCATLLWHIPESCFVLTVGDDAMNGAGILQGDQVIVDRSPVAEHGLSSWR